MWLTTYLGSILTIMLKFYRHKRKKTNLKGGGSRFWSGLGVWAEQVAYDGCVVCVYTLWFQMEIYWVFGIEKGVKKGLLSSFLICSDTLSISCKLWVSVCIFSWTQFMCHSRFAQLHPPVLIMSHCHVLCFPSPWQ